MKLKLLSTVLAALTILTACKKEGPAGPPGKDGNANVQSSTITFSNWTWDGTSNYEYVDFTWSAITSSIANTGTVLIYVSTPAGWAPLPRSIYPNITYSESQRYVYGTGTFRIIIQDSDLTQPAPSSLGTWTIKVLAIASSAREANPDLDWNNYNMVKERFQLKD